MQAHSALQRESRHVVTARIHPFKRPDGEARPHVAPFRLGPWLVRPDRHTISNTESASEARLHPKAMGVLVALAERGTDVYPREELMARVWGDAFVGEEVLTGNIRELRKAFGDDAKHPRFIETVPKRGYRLLVEVGSPETVEAGSASITETTRPSRRRAGFSVLLTASSVVVAIAVAAWLVGGKLGQNEAGQPSFTRLTESPGEELHPNLSPDGEVVVFSAFDGEHWHIYRQRVRGSRPFNLTKGTTADNIHPSFSPDGLHIAFRSERDGGGVFIMGASGESVRRVADFGFNPTWSPDATRLAVSTLRFISPYLAERGPDVELRIVEIATGEPETLVEGRALQPSWSPHGQRIAFWGIERDIWTIPADGGEMVRVTDDREQWRNWNPIWSPEGQHLYFASNRGGSMNVWRIRVDETSGRALGKPEPVTTPTDHIGYFSVSRNAQRIVYASTDVGGNLLQIGFDPEAGSVVGEPIPVTRGSRIFIAPQPSPDGESLLSWTPGPDEGISIVGVDGDNLRPLAVGAARSPRFPRWSPDGKHISYNAFAGPDSTLDAWIIDMDGSRLRQLTDASTQPIQVSYPFWSPDGSRLVVGADEAVHIFEVGNKDGSAEASFDSLPLEGDLRSGFLPFSWSPDGAWLAGHYERNGERGIGVISLPSGSLTQLTDFGWFPVWLADSRRILFTGGQPMAQKLFLIDRTTADYREIFAPANASVETPGLSQDNRTIFYMHHTQEADIWLADFDTENLTSH